MSRSLLRRVISPPRADDSRAVGGVTAGFRGRIISAPPALTTLWLCALLVLAPLPFGSVTLTSSILLAAGCFAALILAAGCADWPPARAPVWWVAGALAAMAALGCLQSLPLPDPLVAVMSPAHRVEVEATRDLLPDDSAPAARLSLAPRASRRAALGWLAAAAALLAAAVAARHRRWRWVLLGTIVGTALLEVFFGVQRLFARATTIWGVEVPGAAGRLRGTFVNADHLALYLEMALVVTFGWVYLMLRRSRRQMVAERRILEVAVPVVCWLALFTGLAFTGSRAGLLAGVAATLAQGVLLAAAQRNWRLAPAGVLASAAAVMVVAWIGLEQGFGRLLGTSAYEAAWNARPQIWTASVELWQRFPLLGSGLGSFSQVFPMVQPPELAPLTWDHAHNDWLEVLVTTGVVGLAIVTAGLWWMVSALRTVLLGARSSSSRAAALAALGAVVAVGLHEAFDFGLTMPANAFTLAVILGAGAGIWRPYGDRPRRVTSPGTRGRRSRMRSSRSEGSGAISKEAASDSPARTTNGATR